MSSQAWFWVGAAVVVIHAALILVRTIWLADLFYSSGVLTVLIGLAPTLVCVGATLLVRQRRARKWLSLLWLLPSVFAFGGGGISSLVVTVGAACLTGWWLTLRGRPGLGYLGLLVTTLLHFGLTILWFLTEAPWSLPDQAQYLGEVGIVGVAVVAGCWFGAIPAFERARQRRIQRREQRLAMQQALQSDGAASYPAAATTNGFAIASLCCGLLGFSLLAVIFGHVARSQIARFGQSGSGLATAGLVLGYIGMLAGLVAAIYLFNVADQGFW